MRIHFERTGGLAGPATGRHCTIDADALPADEAREIRDLIAAAGLHRLAGVAPSKPAGRDMFRYRITVEDAGQRQVVELTEPDATGAVRPLIDWLKKRATPGAPPS
jgi:hypothetical protein